MFKPTTLLLAFILFISVISCVDVAVSVQADDDTLRILTYGSFWPGTFYVSGANYQKNSNSASIDTGAFYFNSGNYGLFNLPLSYYYAYSNTDIAPGNISSNAATLAFVPVAIVEYEETNGVDGFQMGGDTVLGWVRLDKMLPFSVSSSNAAISVTQNGQSVSTKVYYVNATSTNNLFQLQFTIPGAHVDVGGVTLTADSSKANIIINGYYDRTVNPTSLGCLISSSPFTCQSTGPSSNANSRLALASFALSTSASFSAAGQVVNFNSGDNNANLEFNWVTQVNADGTNVNVFSNTTAVGNGQVFLDAKFQAGYYGNFLIHSFDAVRPTQVTWDPTIEKVSVDVSSASASTISFGCFLLLAVLITLIQF